MLQNKTFTIISMVLGVIYAEMGFAQNAPTLVKDLNPGVASSNPRDFSNYNNGIYFIAEDATGITQLFKTDGTAAGTTVVPYTPPRGTLLASATWLNGERYVLLLENTPNFRRIILGKTNFTTTTILDTLEGAVISPSISTFEARNGKLLITYRYASISGAGQGTFILHNGNRNGLIFKEGIFNTRGYTLNITPYMSNAVTFLEENLHGFYNMPFGGYIKSIRPIQNNVPMPTIYKIEWILKSRNEAPPSNLFKSIGIINDKFHVSFRDTLANFTTAGVRTNLKTGMDSILYVTTVGNWMYFVNRRNELWKTDGSIAGTLKLNPTFDTPNELIINLLGGGTSPYILTKAGNITRTYYITPQGTLSRVNFDNDVTYSQPFVSKGVQYVFASRQSTNVTCPLPYLVRYEQTEAQSKFFELRDKSVAFCESYLPSPVSSIVTDNDVIYYGLNTNTLGNELWKLDLKSNPNTYCVSKGIAPWELWISNVTLGTIQNPSNKFKDINTLGYSDYTNLATPLAKGQTYPLRVTPSLSWIGHLAHAYCHVWIDFNKNNVFEINELVLEKKGQNSFNQTITIPNNAITGTTRMRISVKWDGYPTACEAFARGEVEDYTIKIVDGLPIAQPLVATTPLNAMVYEQKVKLDWVRASDSVDHFELQKLKQNSSEFETIHRTIAESADPYHRSYDELPEEGVNEYRLKTILKSGKIGYSPTQKVDYQQLASFTIFPNPTNDDAFVNLKDFENLKVEIAISDVAGKILLKQIIENASLLPHRLNVSKLEKGTYLVHIQSVGKRAVTQKLHIL